MFLNLSTRHGVRDNKNRFDTCKWFLPDPIIAPNSDYELNISVKFVILPDKHKRINFQRGSNLLMVERKTISTGEVSEIPITLHAGAYTNQGFLDAINHNLIRADGTTDTLKLNFAHSSADSSEFTDGIELENVVLRTDNPLYMYRIVHDGVHNAAECLGIHDTTGWVSLPSSPTDPQGLQIANSVMDTYGTRTVTIEAIGFAGNNADVVNRNRRKCCLLTIPCKTTDRYKMMVWEREGGYATGNTISSRCLSCIEISLTDDMGLFFDPRHHWTIGVEIYATPRQYFSYAM